LKKLQIIIVKCYHNLNKIKKKWLQTQRNNKNKNSEENIKYVFADDIKAIKLRKGGKKGGIKIFFKDGEEAVFLDVDVGLPDDVQLKDETERAKLAENDYTDIIKEVSEDANLDKEEDEEVDFFKNDIDKDNDDEEDEDEKEEDEEVDDMLREFVEPLMQELERRIEDVKTLEGLVFQSKYFSREKKDDDITITEAIHNLSKSIVQRHETLSEQLRKSTKNEEEEKDKEKNKEDEEQDDDKENEEPIPEENEEPVATEENEILLALEANNDLWREVFTTIPLSFIPVLSYELEDRIIDLSHVKNVLNNNEIRDFQNLSEIKNWIEKRHQDIFVTWTDIEREKME